MLSVSIPRSVVSLALLLVSNQLAIADDWPQFRGRGTGVAKDSRHPVTWAEDKNVAWKIPIEGVGWSQPIVRDGRVYLTTAVTKDQPKPKTGESGPGFNFFSAEGFSRSFLGGSAPDAEYTWKLICLDLNSGDRLWEKDVRKGNPTIPTHRSNSYASETPICDGQHIYVYVAMAGLYCFDLEGNEVWNKPFEARSIQYGWGTGSSPMLFCRTIYVQCDNEDDSFLVALNRMQHNTQIRSCHADGRLLHRLSVNFELLSNDMDHVLTVVHVKTPGVDHDIFHILLRNEPV